MKKLLLASVLMLFALALGVSAAAGMDLPGSVNADGLQRSNVTGSFTITNSGTVALTNLKISDNAADKYAVVFNETSVSTLAVNTSRTLKFTANIPETESPGNKSIATITINSDQVNKTSKLYFDVGSRLVIKDLDVEVDGRDDSNLNDGDEISKDAAPEDNVEFKIKIENKFEDESDIDMNDVVVTITIDDIDDGDKIELESDEFDLRTEKSKTVTLDFDVPLKVDEGTYQVDIKVEAEGDNNVNYEINWNLDLVVEKERHDLRIQKYSLSRSELSCDRSTTLYIDGINLGQEDEDDTILKIISTNLGIDEERTYAMDSDPDDDDNEFSASFVINVPENKAAGTYPIAAQLFRDETRLENTKSVDIVVKKCEQPAPAATTTTTPTTTAPADTTTTTTTTPTTTTTSATTSVTSGSASASTEKSLLGSKGFIWALVGLNVVAVLALISILVMLLSRP